jgi:hypothetical protein
MDIENRTYQVENKIENWDEHTKKELLKLKESLTTEALSKIGFKIEQGNKEWKYNLVFDINNSLTKKQIEILKQNTNIDLSSLLEIKLYQIEIPINKLVSLAEFINRLINDSNWKNIFLTKKWFWSQSSQYSRHNNTTDFAIKGKVFWNSLIGWTEELDPIIWTWNEEIIINFINKIYENKKIVLSYLDDLKK